LLSLRQVKETFDKIASNFNRTRRRPWPCVMEVLGRLTEGIILDVGCGNGRHSVLACAMGFEAVCMDISVNMVKIALRNLKHLNLYERAHLIVCDARYIPLKNSCVDGIICIATIHHIPLESERRKAVREMLRVLKSTGIAVFSAWSIWNLKRFITAMKTKLRSPFKSEIGDALIPWGRRALRFYHLYTLRGLVKTIRSSGFDIKKYYGERGKIFKDNLVVVARKP